MIGLDVKPERSPEIIVERIESRRHRRQRGGRAGRRAAARSDRREVEPLDELEGLAETAGVEVVGHLTQRRERPDAATYLGKGKVEELRLLVEATDADVVIFDNDLGPAQTRNLEKALGCQGARPHRADPRHLRQPGADLPGPAGGRTGPARIRAAAAQADVDAPVAPEARRRRAARPGRKAVGSRPPAGREADPRPASDELRRDRAPQGARGGRAAATG